MVPQGTALPQTLCADSLHVASESWIELQIVQKLLRDAGNYCGTSSLLIQSVLLTDALSIAAIAACSRIEVVIRENLLHWRCTQRASHRAQACTSACMNSA